MTSFLGDAASLIIQVVFGLYTLAVMLRLLFQLVRADFYNPVSQFLVALTNPLLRPLRRIIPGLYGIDLAAVLLLLALKSLEIYLTQWIAGFSIAPITIVVVAVFKLLDLLLNVYLFAIFLRVILSWLNPQGMRHNPAGDLLTSLTEPLLRRARRLLPPVGGLDLSPIAVLVIIQLVQLALKHLLA